MNHVYRLRHGVVVHYPAPPPKPEPARETPPVDFKTADMTTAARPVNDPKAKVHRMKRRQNIAIYDQLREWKNELHTDRPKYKDVAVRISTALGFEVSETNLRRAIADLDMGWFPKRGNGKRAKDPKTRHNLYRRVRALEHQVKVLCTNLGIDVPAPPSEEPPAI